MRKKKNVDDNQGYGSSEGGQGISKVESKEGSMSTLE